MIVEEEEAVNNNNHKVIPINDDEQSSPRGVLESDCQSSLSSRGSSFNEKSPPSTEGDTDSATDEDDGGRAAVRWRSLVFNLKSKSLKVFSRKSLMKKPNNNNNTNNNEVAVDGGDWAVTKPSWRNFTFQELYAATDGFSHGNNILLLSFPINIFI